MGMRRMWLGLSVTVSVAAALGCTSPPEDADVRMATLEREGKQMDAALDTVETRLLGNQSTVAMWQELGRRHQEVSAIQCKVADAHLVAIMQHYERMEEKARRLKRRNGSGDSVASASTTVLTSGKAPRRAHY
ncbi:hypothetical protein JGU66_06400 [Myxococcaceae bacterium JPH2]|nr:hypothetical protein [Myxococcaceae bacterium JPH2]